MAADGSRRSEWARSVVNQLERLSTSEQQAFLRALGLSLPRQRAWCALYMIARIKEAQGEALNQERLALQNDIDPRQLRRLVREVLGQSWDQFAASSSSEIAARFITLLSAFPRASSVPGSQRA